MRLKTTASAPARVGLGSHAGSHTDEQPRDAPNLCGQPGEMNPRSRTDLNGSGRPHWNLRIRRSSLRPEGARVVAWLRSGDGPLSVRARPSSLKRDCDRRATSTGEKRLVNVHAKSRLTLETSTDTPVRNQGPGRSLPGPDAGHPLQGAGRNQTGHRHYRSSSASRKPCQMIFRASWSGRCHAARRVSELASGECLVLRSGEQLGDDDGPGYRVGGQEAEIQQGVDVGPQQEPVGDGVGVWSSVGRRWAASSAAGASQPVMAHRPW